MALAALLATANCLAQTAYVPTDTDATLRYADGYAQHAFCTDTAHYERQTGLFSRRAKSSNLPSGKRVTLTSGLNIMVSKDRWQHCAVRLSFVPQAGASYLADVRVNAAGNCEPELVREDPSAPTGVAPEPSLGPPSC